MTRLKNKLGLINWKQEPSNTNTRGFPKVDHLGINARIVLEQNEFSKKGTSDKN